MNIYRCPLDKTNSPTFKSRQNKLSTYIENGAIVGYGTVTAALRSKASLDRTPTMLWEPNDVALSYNDGASRPDDNEGWARGTASWGASC